MFYMLFVGLRPCLNCYDIEVLIFHLFCFIGQSLMYGEMLSKFFCENGLVVLLIKWEHV